MKMDEKETPVMKRKKRKLFESPSWVTSLFTFSEIKDVSGHFHTALTFWFFFVKKKEHINLSKRLAWRWIKGLLR